MLTKKQLKLYKYLKNYFKENEVMPVFEEMMQHPLTDTWNDTFMGQWVEMNDAGLLKDLPVTLH